MTHRVMSYDSSDWNFSPDSIDVPFDRFQTLLHFSSTKWRHNWSKWRHMVLILVPTESVGDKLSKSVSNFKIEQNLGCKPRI